MKRLNILMSLTFAAIVANAQTSFGLDGSALKPYTQPEASLPAGAARAEAETDEPQLADNQKYLGNDINETKAEHALGLNIEGDYKAGTFLPKSLLDNFIGCKIVGLRFFLNNSVGKSAAFVMPVDNRTGNVNDAVLTKDIETTEAGWNYVKFDWSYTISTTTLRGLMIGYNFTQNRTDSPVAGSGTEATSGLMIYGNLNDGEGWYRVTEYGNLMAQLIIEREGGFLAYDLALNTIIPIKFAKSGSTQELVVYTKNYGTAEASNVTFGVSVDDKEIGTFGNDNQAVGNDEVAISGNITIPTDIKTGRHNLAVYLKSVEGKDPEGNLDNDRLTSSFNVYDQSLKRQKQLVEHYTSQYCRNCPLGYDVLSALQKKRGDVAWVSIHGDMTQTQTDIYTVTESSWIRAFSSAAYPSASFNRYYLNSPALNSYNTLALPIGYRANQTNDAVEMFSELLDMSNDEYPTFATINIATTYDEATRKLDVKVSGQTVDNFTDMLGDDAMVTVYLTEDNLLSKQLNTDGTTINKYPHDNVLRAIISAPLGDNINLSGNAYENDYSLTLDDSWKAANMHVVALISRPFKYVVKDDAMKITSSPYDLFVDNAEMVKVGDSVTAGMNGVKADGDRREVARYTVSGQRVSSPVKGVNIVKYADGTSAKVIVK